MTSVTDAARVRIMLVDDHPLVRDGLRARLDAVPHLQVVAEAGSGAEAVAQAAVTEVDLVLMDISMRGGSGIDTTVQLTRQHPAVRVLILSMHDKPEYLTQAIQAGARGYVLKDAPGKEIVQAIDTVTAGGIYYSAALARQLVRSSVVSDDQLTLREREVLRHLANGASNKHIARALDLSVRTVETHRLNIKRKLRIEGAAELIRFAVRHAGDPGDGP